MEDVLAKITIEYDCPCDHGMCEHAVEKVQEAIQKAYDQGVKDGASKAMGGLKEMLKKNFPSEFELAQKMAEDRKNKELSN